MKRQRIVVALGIAAGLWWGAGTGRADQDANLARGFSPEKLYDYSGLDSVNLYNGALTLVLPIGPRYPVGDQFSYGLTLSYSSNVWDPLLNSNLPQMVPRRSSDSGLGWMLSLGGQLYGRTHPTEHPHGSARYQFESEDGSTHVFYWALHPGEPGEDPEPDPQPCAFTRDNTYLRLCGFSGETRTIEFPDGTKRTYTRLPTFEGMRAWDVDRYRLTKMEDRFGNWVEVAYGGGMWTITDSLDRSHTVSFHSETVDGDPMWVLDSANLEGFGGARSLYDFEYDETVGGAVDLVEIDRSCKTHPEAPGDETVFVPLLRKVLLPPDESGFRMSFQMPDYNTECFGALKDLPGTLGRLVLPTGGQLEWTYGHYLFRDLDPEDPEDDIFEQTTGVKTGSSGIVVEPG